MAKDETQLLNVKKATFLLGINSNTIRRWAKTGKLKGIKVGSRGDWRFTKEALLKMVKEPVVKQTKKTYTNIKKFLKENANELQKLATQHHKELLETPTLRTEFLDKYQKFHIKILKLLAANLDDTEKGLTVFRKLGEQFAKQAVKDGLSIEEAVDGTIFLKQAIWEKLEQSELLDELSTHDLNRLSKIMAAYIDVLSSKIAFTYHEAYTKNIAKNLEERKQAEVAFQDAKKYAEDIVETIREPLIVMDKNLRVVSANESFYNTFQVSKKETEGNLIYKLGNEQWNIPELRELLEKILPKSTQFNNYEVKHRFENIGQKTMLLNARRIDSVQLILLAIEDITKRREAEESAAKSEKQYQTLFHSMDEGFCIIEVLFDRNNKSIDYRFLEINSAFEKQTGIKNGKGRLMREIAPQHEQHWFDIYGKIALTGQSLRFENSAKALGRFYEVYAFRVGAPKNRQVGIVFNDITRRKKAEEHLHYLATLTEHVIDAIIATDLEFKITSWNKGAEELYGWKAKEVIGKSVRDIIPTQFPDSDGATEWQKSLKETGYWKGEVVQKRRDGMPIPTLASVGYIKNGKGKPIGMVAVNRDIRERKKLEQRKDDFIALASHELKTPVTSLKMFTQMLHQRFQKQGDKNVTRSLSAMDKQLTKLTELVNGLLDISRLESGKLQYKKELFAVDDLVKETVNYLQEIVTSHKLMFDGQTQQKIVADRDRIGQVLTNLINNAVKYSPKGDRIVIRSKKNKDTVIVSVQDFGVGIPKSEQENQNDIIMPDSAIIQEFCDSASYALAKLEFERKQAILRKTVEKVIANQLWMDVTGYLPIGKEVELCAESRNSHSTTPYLDFEYEFIAPKPRKERIIVARDELGRIIHSQPPQIL